LGCVLLLALHKVLERLPNTTGLFPQLLKYFFYGTEDSAIDKNSLLGSSDIIVWNILLLDNGVFHASQKVTINKEINQ